MSSERRRYPRAVVLGTASVFTESRVMGTYVLENLSAGGALLSGAEGLSAGARLHIVLHLGNQAFAVDALVVREHEMRGRSAFAVAFDRAPMTVVEPINAIIEERLARERKSNEP